MHSPFSFRLEDQSRQVGLSDGIITVFSGGGVEIYVRRLETSSAQRFRLAGPYCFRDFCGRDCAGAETPASLRFVKARVFRPLRGLATRSDGIETPGLRLGLPSFARCAGSVPRSVVQGLKPFHLLARFAA